jgi:predicted enzyme related to lactoylglutathione lyase
MQKWNRALAATTLLLAVACASNAPPWIPPVTAEPTGLYKPGKFVWVDLVTDDAEGAKAFYGALFGWTFEEKGRYNIAMSDGVRVAGIVTSRDPDRSEWIGNLSVSDVDRSVELAQSNGGAVEHEAVDAPDRGRLALVSDPGGAVVLLVRSSTGDTPDRLPPVGSFLWRELWTHDLDAALGFYSAVAGHTPDTVDLDGQPYAVLKVDDIARAGVMIAPPEVNPLWLPYVRVEDPLATAERAVELGARLIGADDDAAILVDPTGAPIGVQYWETPSGGEAR